LDSNNPSHSAATSEAVKRILAETFGGPVMLGAGQEPKHGSGRSSVLRYPVLDGPDGAPASVIIKQVKPHEDEPYDPDAADGPAMRLFNEWAGLQFLSALALPEAQAPRFYGGDRTIGLIVRKILARARAWSSRCWAMIARGPRRPWTPISARWGG
jgi:hypothetical protein